MLHPNLEEALQDALGLRGSPSKVKEQFAVARARPSSCTWILPAPTYATASVPTGGKCESDSAAV